MRVWALQWWCLSAKQPESACGWRSVVRVVETGVAPEHACTLTSSTNIQVRGPALVSSL